LSRTKINDKIKRARRHLDNNYQEDVLSLRFAVEDILECLEELNNTSEETKNVR